MEPQEDARADEMILPMMGDLLAVIASAKARGGVESLERWIRNRLPDATNEEVSEAADVCVEIIDSIPVFLARAHQEAEERGLWRPRSNSARMDAWKSGAGVGLSVLARAWGRCRRMLRAPSGFDPHVR